MPAPALGLTQLFSNNAVSLLVSPISETATSLTVMPGYGTLYPQPSGAGDYFLITLENQSGTTREIIKVTNRIGDVLYFTLADRGLENTGVQSWPVSNGNDTLVDHRVTADTMRRAMLKPLASSIPGNTIYNADFTLELPDLLAETTEITLDSNYQASSVCLYLGGIRQKLNTDYIESAADKIKFLFVLTQDEIDDGQNVVIDYISA